MNYLSNWLPFNYPTPTAEEWAAEYARRGLEYRKATLLLLAIGLIVPFNVSCLSLYFGILTINIVCTALLWRKQIYYENVSKLDTF